MLVFSVSLIRLVYDMIHKDVNPALQIVSAWMVLSVGLIDAMVYVSLLDLHFAQQDADIQLVGSSRVFGQTQSPPENGRQIVKQVNQIVMHVAIESLQSFSNEGR